MLLSPDEPPAVEVREGDGCFLVVCEHASNRIPQSLGRLGLRPVDLDRHIAWDLGALQVASGVAVRLRGTLIFQRYSRLVIDCNRSLDLPDTFSTFSEDTEIPGNIGLAESERAIRVAEVWSPFHDAIDLFIDRRINAGLQTVLVTIHTFTPVYRGVARPWHVGVISTDERGLADRLLGALRADPSLVVGDNEPYSAKDNVDYSIRRHGRDRGLPHVMIEIRNDLLGDNAGRDAWVNRLATLFQELGAAAAAA